MNLGLNLWLLILYFFTVIPFVLFLLIIFSKNITLKQSINELVSPSLENSFMLTYGKIAVHTFLLISYVFHKNTRQNNVPILILYTSSPDQIHVYDGLANFHRN